MKKIDNYWAFQFAGWITLVAISFFFAATLGKFTLPYVSSVLLTVAIGLTLTHIMRIMLKKGNLFSKNVKEQVYSLIVYTLIFSFIYGFLTEILDSYFIKLNPKRIADVPFWNRVLIMTFNSTWIILTWNFIYFAYHYIKRSQQQQLDTLKLEAAVKNLELRTIKSHINPHFIFNSLNSIRALVDENPQRARKAITELSNILRSSLTAENMETVPMKEELGIVEDYLALEQIRFEERLQVKLDIAPETLEHPIPPMMLQTLVENAIKHGISKRIDGGFVQVYSAMVNGHHEIRVLNSGSLNGNLVKGSKGFGVKSTEDRLNLLYQGKAKFEIADREPDSVECKIVMPL